MEAEIRIIIKLSLSEALVLKKLLGKQSHNNYKEFGEDNR